jgi:hypothetical protein
MAKKKGAGPTKVDAVREALKEGVGSPQIGAAYVKQKFALGVTRNNSARTNRSRRRRAPPAARPRPSARSGKGTPYASADPVQLALKVKQLVRTYGPPAVSDMLAILTD